MNCEEAREILLTGRAGELDEAREREFSHHLDGCDSCSLFMKSILGAETTIARYKDAVPEITDPKSLTRSIMSAINAATPHRRDESRDRTENIIDSLTRLFATPAVRFACSLVLLACGLSYALMEFDDAGSIVQLERRLGGESSNSTDTTQAFAGGPSLSRLINSFAAFVNGTLSYESAIDKFRSIDPEDARLAMSSFGGLNQTVRAKFDSLQQHIDAGPTLQWNIPRSAEEIQAFRRDLLKLQKSLTPYIEKGELP